MTLLVLIAELVNISILDLLSYKIFLLCTLFHCFDGRCRAFCSTVVYNYLSEKSIWPLKTSMAIVI